MKGKLLKSAALVTLLTISASVFAGCTPSTPSGNTGSANGSSNTETAAAPSGDGTTVKAPTGQVIRYNLGADPKTLDPALNTAVEAGSVLENLFEGLMKLDEKELPVPGMAESYEISKDGLVYTFKLRDAKWSDGQPVKADDFKYAWIRALDPNTKPNPAEYAYQLFYIKNGQKFNSGEAKAEDVGIKVVDDKTLEVTLEAPTAYFLSLMAFPTYFPVRKDMVEKDPEKWATQAETYISNGPFKFVSWASKSKLIIEKNPNYYDADKVKLNKIEMTLVDDSQTYLAAFKNGELDMIESPPPQDIPQLIADKTAEVLPYLGTYFYVLNMRENLKDTNPDAYKALSNPDVRKALYLAIDKKAIVENVAKGGQTPAWSYVPMGVKDDQGNNFAEFKKYYEKDAGDIEEAKKLLEKAGYPNGQGFPKLVLKYNNGTGHQNIAVAVQAMWQQNLGIQVDLANEEWAVFQTSRVNGDFEIARHGWIADYNDPMTFLDMWVTGSGTAWGNNNAHYSNPEYDKLVNGAKVEQDMAKRTQMLHDAEAILMQDLPVFPIYYYTNVVCYRPYIKDIRKSSLGFVFFKDAYIQE